MSLAHGGRRFFTSLALAGLAALIVLGLRRARPASESPVPEYRAKGPAAAPVSIVEFSDVQCSSCRAAQAPLEALMSRHPGKIRLMFKHFPTEKLHRWAREASQSAECAGRQGRFWEMLGVLFSRQPLWAEEENAPELMKGYAEELGLDRSAFASCLADPAAAAAIERDKQEGLRLEINVTPTFFINGKRFVGVKQLQTEGAAHAAEALR